MNKSVVKVGLQYIYVFSSSVCILWSDYCNVLYKHQLIFATFFYYAAIQASMWTWMSSDQLVCWEEGISEK